MVRLILIRDSTLIYNAMTLEAEKQFTRDPVKCGSHKVSMAKLKQNDEMKDE